MVDIGSISGGLYRVLGGIKTLLPYAKAIGGPVLGKVVDMITTAVEVSENIKEQVDNGTVIANSNDAEELQALIAEMRLVNDELANYIAQS